MRANTPWWIQNSRGEFLIIQINRCSFEPNDLKTFTSVCLCFKNTFENFFLEQNAHNFGAQIVYLDLVCKRIKTNGKS